MTLFLFRLDLYFAGIILKSCSVFVNPRLLCSNIYCLPTPQPLENAYIIYSPLGALIYIVQLETCNRCESHPKEKKKPRTCVSCVFYNLLQSCVFEDITNVSQSVCAPPLFQTSNIANPHHTACPRQLILFSLLSLYCSTN